MLRISCCRDVISWKITKSWQNIFLKCFHYCFYLTFSVYICFSWVWWVLFAEEKKILKLKIHKFILVNQRKYLPSHIVFFSIKFLFSVYSALSFRFWNKYWNLCNCTCNWVMCTICTSIVFSHDCYFCCPLGTPREEWKS